MTVTPPEPPWSTPGYAGCEWPLDPVCFDEDWEALSPETKARAASLSSATLRRLTGYRVGGCPITVRPCKRSCASGSRWPSYYALTGQYGLSWYPVNMGGVWVNSCGCDYDCSCAALCEIELPGPVGQVYEVYLDGVEVPATDYRVDGTRLLWVGAGDCPWPACQDMTLDEHQPGTFAVTYLNSYPADQSAAYVNAMLAMEFAHACTGSTCRLPPGVTQVIRQGITFTLPTGAFPDGLTGLREVDAWLAIWNPDHIRQAPSVWSPDIRPPRVVR
jgi:hypothetical protein